MAYLLYKHIRDKRRANELAKSHENEAPGNSYTKGSVSSHENDTTKVEHQEPSPGIVNETAQDKEAKTAEEKEAKKTMMQYRIRLLSGLFFPMLVYALNRTMVAAALPFIASDFHQFAQINWIISASELTAAAFVPSFGQYADIFGRYPTLQVATASMVIGSALCAGAPTNAFPMLLAGRGLQGLASAGMMIVTRIALSDKVSLKENAINNTAFTLINGIGFGVGPVIGGYLTAVSWRWVFIINVPLSIAGLILTHFCARKVMLGPQDLAGHDGSQLSRSASFFARLRTVDFGGQFLFFFGMGLLILALTWAGAYYPWKSAQVLAPLAVGVILLALFLVWEYLLLPGHFLALKFPHHRPMVSLKLVWSRNAGLLMYINLITGMAMYAAFYFVDIFFTLVEQFGSSRSGTNLLYYLPGLGAGAYAAIFICTVWPRRTWYPLSFGTVVEAAGITLMAVAIHTGSLPFVYGMLALTGLGTGVRLMPNTLHAVGYFPTQIASVVSLMSLAVSLGSTLASTIMLNIFNNQLSDAGIKLVSGPASASSFNSINQLSPDVQNFVRDHAHAAIVLAFYGISAFMWLGVVAVAFLGSVEIPKKGSDQERKVTKGTFIGSMLWRREKETISFESA